MLFVGYYNNGLNGNYNLDNFYGRVVGIAKTTKAGTKITLIIKWITKLIFLVKLFLTIIFT